MILYDFLMSPKKIVFTEHAPKPVGPYSQAVIHNGLVYCSGQIAINPDTGALILESIELETKQVLTNLNAVLDAANSSLDDVIKVSIFVSDIRQFDAINAVYETFFSESKPARALVQVAALPKGVNIEVEAIAISHD